MPLSTTRACTPHSLPCHAAPHPGLRVAPCEPTTVRLPPPRAVAAAPPRAAKARELEASTRDVAGGKVHMRSVANGDGTTTVHVDASAVPDTGGLVLHWGVSPAAHPPHDWCAPPEASRPPDSNVFGDGKAVRSRLHDGRLEVTLPKESLEEDGGPASLVGIIVRSRCAHAPSQRATGEAWL